VAAASKKELGIDVELIDGAKGEFTVLVDGRPIVRKGESLPAADEIVAAVRKEMPAHAGR
jgi:hypothetical protein